MSSLKDLREKFLYKISDLLVNYGFNNKPNNDRKKTDFGYIALYFGSVIYNTESLVTISPSLAIRFDEVENLLNLNRDNIKDSVKKRTNTIGGQIGNIYNHKYKDWRISYESDIINICNDIIKFYEMVCIPYIEKYSNLEVILNVLLSGDDDEKSKLVLTEIQEAELAIAIAYVLDKKELLFHLMEEKTKLIK